MGFSALDGLEGLVPKKKKARTAPRQEVVLPSEEIGEPVVVRSPRMVPAPKRGAVERVKTAGEAGGLMTTDRMGVQAITQQRREEVLSWMLNGHLYDSQLMSVQQLALALEIPVKTLERDISALKEKMAEYHTDVNDDKDTPALAYMLMEMKFQDRGRALGLYNIIIGDINSADNACIEQEDKPGKRKSYGLTGRDRAAMYSAALQAMDLANKATNGMDSLFKMTGGVAKLQQIIKTKMVVLNQKGGQLVMNMDTLQQFAATELAGILPSVRKVDPMLSAPPVLDLTPEDEEIMAVGDKERKGR